MRTFNIHDLIEITIYDNVSKGIKDAISFQIGYFEVVKNTHTPYLINIFPYNKFNYVNENTICTFHLIKGVMQKCYHDPAGHLAIVMVDNGYEIYADYPNFLMNLYIQQLLLKEGITLVHAAAVASPEGNVLLLPGAGGVGKTIILGELVKNHRFKLLGDDIVGIDQYGYCYSFPRSFVLKEYHSEIYPDIFHTLGISTNKRLSIKKKNSLKKFIIENAPLIGLGKVFLKNLGIFDTISSHLIPNAEEYLAAVSVDKIFGKNSVQNKGKIQKIIFLQRYQGQEFRLDSFSAESLSRQMFSIIHHEWVDLMRQFFSLGALEIINLPDYFSTVTEIINKNIMGKTTEKLYIPDKASPKELATYFNSLLKNIK